MDYCLGPPDDGSNDSWSDEEMNFDILLESEDDIPSSWTEIDGMYSESGDTDDGGSYGCVHHQHSEQCDPPPDWAQLNSALPSSVQKLLDSCWEMMKRREDLFDQWASELPRHLHSAIASVAGGRLLDITVVVDAILHILCGDGLHLGMKEAVVRTLLECQTLSFTHLFCSDGGNRIVRALCNCLAENKNSTLLQKAVKALHEWAQKVHKKAAEVRDQKVEEWLAEVREASDGQGVDVKTGCCLPTRGRQGMTKCSNYLLTGTCTFGSTCRFWHPFLDRHLEKACIEGGHTFGLLQTALVENGLLRTTKIVVSSDWKKALGDADQNLKLPFNPQQRDSLQHVRRYFDSVRRFGDLPEYSALHSYFSCDPNGAPSLGPVAGEASLSDNPESSELYTPNPQNQLITESPVTMKVDNDVESPRSPEAKPNLLEFDSPNGPFSFDPSNFESSPSESGRAGSSDETTHADNQHEASPDLVNHEEVPRQLIWSVIHGSEREESSLLWKTVFSNRAIGDFRNLQKAQNELSPVLKKLEDLRRGNWNPSNAKLLINHDGTKAKCRVPVYEIQVLNNLRLIWQIDWRFIPELSRWSQCMLIWSVVNHKGISTELKRIHNYHRHYSEEHCRLCRRQMVGADRTFAQPLMEGCQEIPGKQLNFSATAARKASKSNGRDWQEIEAHERFHDVSISMLDILLQQTSDNERIEEIPLQPSEAEYNAMMHSGSALIVGRSGTGKTCCQTARILCRHIASRYGPELHSGHGALSPLDANPPVVRQIFVTVASRLCVQVMDYFHHLKNGVEIVHRRQQQRNNDGAEAQTVGEQDHEEVVDPEWADDDADWGEQDNNDLTFNDDYDDYDERLERHMSRIPDNFAEVTDDQWPLFVPFDKLLRMLEGTLIAKGVLKPHCKGRETAAGAMDHECSLFEIDFSRFLRMWRTFDIRITKRLDPSLVWTEICSIIKGLAQRKDASTRFAPLFRSDYIGASQRMYPEFNEESRGKVYDIYQRYEKEKARNGDRDMLDRLADCANALEALLNNASEKNALAEVQVDEIYCDEVQDMVQLQVKVLLQLCNNAHGLYFSGDTAQSIANGASFKFEHTKDTFYSHAKERHAASAESRGTLHHAAPGSSHDGTGTVARRGVVSWAASFPTCKPAMLHLTENYRSHQGILNVAGTVLDLLKYFFPGSVDDFGKDQSVIAGDPPLFLLETTREALDLHLFGTGCNSAECELGADQAIIVRDSAAREKIQQLIPTAIVLTIYESKGSEFNDVLIYNFFSNSPANSLQSWWALLNFNPDAPSSSEAAHVASSSSPTKSRQSIPDFVSDKHNRLCNELKHLYTAITRARKRLWFFDDDPGLREPMLRIWLAQGVVTTTMDKETVQQLATKSNPEQWAAKGNALFQQKQYSQAAQCLRFSLQKQENPQCRRKLQAAEAYCAKREAEKLANAPTHAVAARAKAQFEKAANKFEALPNRSVRETCMAAICYEHANMFNRAGDLLFSTREPVPMERAVDMYLKAGAVALAANVLDALGRFDASISLLLSKHKVDDALKRLDSDAYSHALANSPELGKLRHRAIRLGIRQIKRRRELNGIKKASSCRLTDTTIDLIMRLTDSYDEQVALLEESGSTCKLVEKLVDHGELRRAVLVLIDEGEYAAAATLLQERKAGEDISQQERTALACLHGHCLLVAAHLAISPGPCNPLAQGIATQPYCRPPVLLPISEGLPALDLGNTGQMKEARRLADEALRALCEVPTEEMSIDGIHPGVPSPREMQIEAHALVALCQRDAFTAMQHARSLREEDGFMGEVGARCMLTVLSQVLLQESSASLPMTMFGSSEAAWTAGTEALRGFASLVRQVLSCCSPRLSVAVLRQRCEKEARAVSLARSLCGLSPARKRVAHDELSRTHSDLDKKSWEKMARLLVLSFSMLVRAWEWLSRNLDISNPPLRSVCPGIRLFFCCYRHPHEEAEESNGAYQRRWATSIARQAAMVDLLGWGGMQWIKESAQGLYLDNAILSDVLPTLRRWVEPLAESLLPGRGAGLGMAPTVLADSLAALPISARASVAELITRVWLKRECTSFAAIPGKVLHGGMLLLQLGWAGSVEYWRPARTWSSPLSEDAEVAANLNKHHSLLQIFRMLEGVDRKEWENNLVAGIDFVEEVLAEVGTGRSGFVYSNTGGFDGDACPLVPMPLVLLLEALITVASMHTLAIAVKQKIIFLPEPYVRAWLVQKPKLLQAVFSSKVAASYLPRCVMAATRLLRMLWSKAFLPLPMAGVGFRKSCAPCCHPEEQHLWEQAEMALRLSLAIAVGVTNTPEAGQRSLLMLHVNENHPRKILRTLSRQAGRWSLEEQYSTGWGPVSAIHLLGSLASTETLLRNALLEFCSSGEMHGAMALFNMDAVPHTRAASRCQTVRVDRRKGSLMLKTGANQWVPLKPGTVGGPGQIRSMDAPSVPVSGPSPIAVDGAESETLLAEREEEEERERREKAWHTIVAWKRKIWKMRANRGKVSRHLAEVKASVAEWRESGKFGSLAYGMIFLGVVVPHNLVRRLNTQRTELMKQAECFSCEADFDQEEDILDQHLPRVDRVLRELDRLRPIITDDGGYDVHALAVACQEGAMLLEDDHLMQRLEGLKQNTLSCYAVA